MTKKYSFCFFFVFNEKQKSTIRKSRINKVCFLRPKYFASIRINKIATNEKILIIVLCVNILAVASYLRLTFKFFMNLDTLYTEDSFLRKSRNRRQQHNSHHLHT